MRGVVACLPAIFVVVVFSSVGCSHGGEKHKKELLQITTTTLPDATEGVAYSATIEATGGATPYTWTVSGLPSGLTWSQVGDSVEISGTPAAGTAGTYNIGVTVSDSSSPAQSDSTTLRLEVKALRLRAGFEASPTYGTAPLAVTFTNKSTGAIIQWQWDFDNDGTVDSYEQNPQWTYNNPGWYTVKLTVSDGTNTNTCVKEKCILVVAGNVYYVDGVNGDDANGGTGWSDAWRTIGKALSVAGNNDLVLVADTTYNETDLNFNGKKIHLKGVDHNTAGQQPVIDCQSNGRAFYFGSGETKDSVVDNFTIQNGSVEDTYGGAILCENNSSPTIANCVFQNNETVDRNSSYDNENGGAIYCDNSSPMITDCVFSGNGADAYGGAIYCDNSSSPTLTNCTFSDNSADWGGGAICCNYSSPTLTNCTFSNNNANGDGGAIYCDNSSSPTLTNCAFSDNSTSSCGGAISCWNYSSLAVTNCVFSGNSASNDGGAIYCASSSPTLTNCTFSGNSAGSCGGAICCISDSSPTSSNCILWGDSASSGGNEIYIWDSGSSCTLNYCCVKNAGYGGQTGNITENNCISADPQFVDAANGDYHLQDTSPCIDAGKNSYVPSGVTTDLDGNSRIVSGTVDIGAYEHQP